MTSEADAPEGEVARSGDGPDIAAIRDLIETNIPLVEHIVTRVSAGFPSHFAREDLVQAGLLGLTQSARRFDPERGIAFSTFVGRRIEGAVLDVLRNADWAPRSVRVSERALTRIETDLTSARGGAPGDDEIADAMGLSAQELADLRSRINQGVIEALDRPIGGEASSATLSDTLADPCSLPLEQLETRELHAYLRDAIDLLPERHRIVVIGFFFEGRSISDLGRFLGVTQSRASQLKDAALKMIRDALEARDRDDGLEPVPARNAAYAAAVAAHRTLEQRLSELTSPLSRVV